MSVPKTGRSLRPRLAARNQKEKKALAREIQRLDIQYCKGHGWRIEDNVRWIFDGKKKDAGAEFPFRRQSISDFFGAYDFMASRPPTMACWQVSAERRTRGSHRTQDPIGFLHDFNGASVEDVIEGRVLVRGVVEIYSWWRALKSDQGIRLKTVGGNWFPRREWWLPLPPPPPAEGR